MKQQKKNKKKHRILISILACLLAVVITVIVIQEKRSLHPEDRERARQALIDQAKNIRLPGEIVYESLEDRGCDVGFRGIVRTASCFYDLERYYKNNQDLEKDLEKANDLILSLGWKAALHNSGQYPGKPSINLSSYPSGNIGYSIDESFLKNKQISVKKGEYIYGIRMSYGYWGCSQNSVFELPCPQLPANAIRAN